MIAGQNVRDIVAAFLANRGRTPMPTVRRPPVPLSGDDPRAMDPAPRINRVLDRGYREVSQDTPPGGVPVLAADDPTTNHAIQWLQRFEPDTVEQILRYANLSLRRYPLVYGRGDMQSDETSGGYTPGFQGRQ